jgi:platelet-activating factor acetylhydrolase
MEKKRPNSAKPPRQSGGVRPPKTLREHVLHILPYYTGPYGVGYLEIEAPVREPRTISDLKRDHEHLLRLDTVLFSAYYPCKVEADVGENPKAVKKLNRAMWLPKPKVPTCKGYAKFMSIPHMPVTAYIACTSMFTKLPAFRNAKLAEHWPVDMLSEKGPTGDAARQDEATRQDEGSKANEPSFPVIIFSHGLGGSRTLCSSICGELASYGFIVLAVEHRDGSGARTYVNLPENKEVSRQQSDVNINVDDVSSKKRKKDPESRNQHYKVDYLFPKDNAQDTAPHNARGVDTELRNAQIEMRMAEIEEAYYILELINSGQGKKVTDMNLRRKGNMGASSRGLDGIDWDDWRGRVHTENVTIMGHSFGGATTVQVVRNESLAWVGQGILLDAWGPATPEVGDNPRETIKKPILSIGSEAFMHWRENFDRLVGIANEARENNALCWMLTVRGSTHLSQTDFAMLYGKWMSLYMKTLVDPRRMLHLTIAASLEFLKIALPPEQTKYNTWVDEEILKTADAPEEPDAKVSLDHRPDDKWIAVRLKLENELSVRTRKWVQRKTQKLFSRRRSDRTLVDWGEGNEIWMHFSPTHEEVEEHMEQNAWATDRNRSYALQCTII